ncbi:MAG TPA: SAM-dependent methyltransferase [Actinopolymorphaceae bacterium]
MPEPLPAALDRVAALVLDDARLVRAVAAGRRKGQDRPRWRRVELRYVDLAAGRHLQVTEYDETQAFTRNLPLDDALPGQVRQLLDRPYGNWHVDGLEETLQLRVTKKGEAQVHVAARARDGGTPRPEPDRRHDRRKKRVIDPAEPFLHALGVTDAEHRIKPTRRDKYRQVEEFVRQLGAAVDDARAAGALREPTAERPWHVLDLGCGNAYLTFAAYAYLDGVRELPVRMLGIDVKAQAREHNTSMAERLGWSTAMTFAQTEIDDAEIEVAPDIVLALHACDTATDDALATAVRRKAPLILAAPCCQHDLQAQLRSAPPPEPYGLVMRHGILRERLADVLTDGLRAAILRMVGYRVDVVEFVESAHTPRNLLIRAVRTGAEPSPQARQDYRAMIDAWGVRPALDALLEVS